jgi:hypothetical protein
MDIEQARQDIMTWLTTFVEQPHPKLMGWAPCPYARRARLDNKLEIQAGRLGPYIDLMHIDIGDLDVVALVYDPEDFDSADFNHEVRTVNTGFLGPRNLIALADHPDDPEVINGVVMNQGRWAIAFVQSLSKLEGHARMLAEKGYYQNWPESYLETLFENRQDPRS